MARKGLAKPIGSMTQYDKIRVGRGKDKQYLHYGEIVPLTQLDDIVFGAWDVYPANAYESALNAEVLRDRDIEPVRDELKAIVPMKAAFDHNYAKRLDGLARPLRAMSTPVIKVVVTAPRPTHITPNFPFAGSIRILLSKKVVIIKI